MKRVIGTAARTGPVLGGSKRVGSGECDDPHRVDVADLVRAEEVRLVERERTAHRAAITLLLEGRLLPSEEVLRVERAVAAKIESAAAELVAPRLAYHGDDCAQRAAVLCIELIAEHLELLDSLLGEVHRRAAPDCIVDVTAV